MHQQQHKTTFESWQKHTLKSKDLQMVFGHEPEYASNELQKPCNVKSRDPKSKQNKIAWTYTE